MRTKFYLLHPADLHKLFQWCREPSKRPDIEQLLTSDKALYDSINWQNGEKMTMLHIATIAQNLSVVELLLANHSNFDLADCYGNTPIDIANGTEKTPLSPSAQNEKIYQRFLQYRRINALNVFIQNGSLPDVKRLLKEAPTEYNLHVHQGMAPLHIAAQHGKSSAIICASKQLFFQ
jgi:ankyrin repeat protein